ncbi:MAG: hypothetical protein ABR517_11090 [Thermoanaerobaculia bacterium]
MHRILVLSLALLCVSAAVLAQQAPPKCDAPEYRQFDFWVGEWSVESPDGKFAGTNSIRVEMNGCVLHERWKGAGGGGGESFNIWDRTRGVWHQTWVDGFGTLLLLEGGIDGKSMRLEGKGKNGKGQWVRQRIIWTPMSDEECNGCVRQKWETTQDGEAWATVFDGIYKPVGKTD